MTLVALTTTKGFSSWKARASLGGDETGLWGRSLRGSLSVISHQPPSHGAGIQETTWPGQGSLPTHVLFPPCGRLQHRPPAACHLCDH